MVGNKSFPKVHIESLKRMDIQKSFLFLGVLFNNPVNCWDYIVNIIDVWNVGMEQWWNDINRHKPKYPLKNLFHCYFDYNKSQIIAWD
jgi:hypothetical protein